MRIVTVMILFVLCNCANAATAYWNGINIIGGVNGGGVGEYGFGSIIHGEDHASWIHTSMFGHTEAGIFYLKHEDFSHGMDPTYNWWALAVYGDIVSETTFASLTPIEDFRGNDVYTGGTLIPNPSDFYMAFKVSEVLIVDAHYEEGMTWYGWAHVSIDDSMEMTLLDAGINLYGGEVIVGATPEPSTGMLFLLGAAALGLRRKRGSEVCE